MRTSLSHLSHHSWIIRIERCHLHHFRQLRLQGSRRDSGCALGAGVELRPHHARWSGLRRTSRKVRRVIDGQQGLTILGQANLLLILLPSWTICVLFHGGRIRIVIHLHALQHIFTHCHIRKLAQITILTILVPNTFTTHGLTRLTHWLQLSNY